MSDVTDRMREAGKVQADPALAAIQDLSDSVASSFEVLEKQSEKVEEKAERLHSEGKADLERVRTEMAAGFKHHSDKLNTLDRRSIALGYGGTRDIEGACLASLDEEQRKWIPKIAGSIPLGLMGRREQFPIFANPVSRTAIALWFQASTNIQLRKGSKADQDRNYATMERIENAIKDVFPTETAAALWTQTDILGGHWLPEPVSSELYRLITDNSVLAPLVSHVPMVTKTLDLPVEGSTLTVTWGGSTTNAENLDITDSVPASPINKVTLTAQRLNGYAESSMEELMDSPVSILSWIQMKLTELCGREIDRVLLEGVVGTIPNFVGLGTHASVNAITAGTNGDVLTYAMLVAQVFRARERASRASARWFMSPEAMAKVIGLVDTAGMPIVQFGNVPNAFAASLLGFPIEVHSAILANRTQGTGTTGSHIYFGPPQTIVIGDRLGMSWDVSEEFKFRAATVCMRLMTRIGLGIAVPAAWTRHEFVMTA